MKLAPYILERLTSVNRTNGTADLLVPLLWNSPRGVRFHERHLPGFSTGPLSEWPPYSNRPPVPNMTKMGTSSATASPCARLRMSLKLTTAVCMPGARWTP